MDYSSGTNVRMPKPSVLFSGMEVRASFVLATPLHDVSNRKSFAYMGPDPYGKSTVFAGFGAKLEEHKGKACTVV